MMSNKGRYMWGVGCGFGGVFLKYLLLCDTSFVIVAFELFYYYIYPI